MSNRSAPTIYLLGPGAVGLLWASALAATGIEVRLLGRKLPAENPLEIRTNFGDKHRSRFTRLDYCTAKQVTGPIKILFVTVKAYQMGTAAAQCKALIDDNTSVVLLQNGMGSEAAFLRAISPLKPKLYFGVMTHGVLRNKPDEVTLTGRGECWFGSEISSDTTFPAALKCLAATDLCSGWDPQIHPRRVNKLLINAQINPLTALLNCRNGELLSPTLTSLRTALAAECATIANTMVPALRYDTAQILRLANQVAHTTADNFSSMHQDLAHQRDSEIAFINGYLVDAAQRVSIPAPINHMLQNMIEFMATPARHQNTGFQRAANVDVSAEL